MQTFFLVAGFIFGLIVGSFLNAVIYRLHKGKSLGGYSACPHCRHRLAAEDLVPILSFFLLKRRCRYCKAKISWQYPLVEFSTGVLFFLFVFGSIAVAGSPEAVDYYALGFKLVFASLLIAIFTFDLKYYLIPDVLVLVGILTGLAYRAIFGISFSDGLIGAGILLGFFGILYLASWGRWIGFGDVKLGIFLGMILGLKMALLMLMLAYVSGALVGVAMILAKKTTMKGVLPFGTFLTAASLVVMLWGEELLTWYLSFF